MSYNDSLGIANEPRPTQSRVSVVIPAYNVAEYVREAVESVLAQTYGAFEVIVVNDGSPDTAELENALSDCSDRLIYLKQQNAGAAAARNTGIKKATGDYVAFLDADDVWLPNYLEEQLKFLESSHADLVYCDALLTGESPLSGKTYMETTPSTGDVTPESLLALKCNVITSGVVVRRTPLVRVGMFDESIRRAHDFDLWLRLAKQNVVIKYQRQVLLQHRILTTGLSGDNVSQQERALHVLGTITQRMSLSQSEQEALAETLRGVEAALSLEKGKVFLQNGEFAAAVKAFQAANAHYRRWKLRLVVLGLRCVPMVVLRFYRTKESLL
jgi:cellulose synthase/poly-beta-1,6-N-acetylglucosamine synthase-like glycosyltransferase